MKRSKRARKSLKFDWERAPDIKLRVHKLVKLLKIESVNLERVFFFRSVGSKSRAYARTWGLPRIWQNALDEKPGYIIEVISHYFDNLNEKDQDKVLLHELSHIPKNFSGALVPHTKRRKGSFHDKLEKIYEVYRNSR